MKISADISDYDFIIKIIQYLESNFGIVFFISSRDFDVLYRWWEKRIPLAIIREAIDEVVARWQVRHRRIYSFANFSYAIKKKYQGFLELSPDNRRIEPQPEKFSDIEEFLANYPRSLSKLKPDFEELYLKLKSKESFDMDHINEKLLNSFLKDKELNLKVKIFLKNLSPELRTPVMEKKYRLNFLINKYKIPDFADIE